MVHDSPPGGSRSLASCRCAGEAGCDPAPDPNFCETISRYKPYVLKIKSPTIFRMPTIAPHAPGLRGSDSCNEAFSGVLRGDYLIATQESPAQNTRKIFSFLPSCALPRVVAGAGSLGAAS